MKVNFDKEQESMRKEIRILKAVHGLKSKDVAAAIGLNLSTFNNWLGGADFGEEKKYWVQFFIDDMKTKSITDMVKGE